MALPLGGVRGLDLSEFLACPFGTQILGDLGAEVIEIEQPGVGDGCRDFLRRSMELMSPSDRPETHRREVLPAR